MARDYGKERHSRGFILNHLRSDYSRSKSCTTESLYNYNADKCPERLSPEWIPDPIGEFGWDGAAGGFATVDPGNRVSLTYFQEVQH